MSSIIYKYKEGTIKLTKDGYYINDINDNFLYNVKSDSEKFYSWFNYNDDNNINLGISGDRTKVATNYSINNLEVKVKSTFWVTLIGHRDVLKVNFFPDHIQQELSEQALVIIFPYWNKKPVKVDFIQNIAFNNLIWFLHYLRTCNVLRLIPF